MVYTHFLTGPPLEHTHQLVIIQYSYFYIFLFIVVILTSLLFSTAIFCFRILTVFGRGNPAYFIRILTRLCNIPVYYPRRALLVGVALANYLKMASPNKPNTSSNPSFPSSSLSPSSTASTNSEPTYSTVIPRALRTSPSSNERPKSYADTTKTCNIYVVN